MRLLASNPLSCDLNGCAGGFGPLLEYGTMPRQLQGLYSRNQDAKHLQCAERLRA